jgi:hypothetical protein
MRILPNAVSALALAAIYGSRLINADPSSPVKTTKRSSIDSLQSNAAMRTRSSSQFLKTTASKAMATTLITKKLRVNYQPMRPQKEPPL